MSIRKTQLLCYTHKMKKDRYDSQPLMLTDGYFSDKYYNSYEMLSKSINNWQQLCPYQLRPDGLSGRHRILQLHSMQIVYAHRKGGTMHNAGSAKDSLSIAVVESCADKACFGRMKIQVGDILFFDDSHLHNFITNDAIEFIVISIQKSSLGSQLSKLSKVLDQRIKDTDAHFTATLHKIWQHFTDTSREKNGIQNFQEAEKKILAVIKKLLTEQTPMSSRLRIGEQIALDIRDQVFHHMDGNVSIQSLAKQYKISEQTLQNSFKSLFGFTPKRFLRLLKLNLVHYELQNSNPTQTTVSRIASKWGFVHMGRFSIYYRELFGIIPSETLKTPSFQKKNIEELCVLRRDEMI